MESAACLQGLFYISLKFLIKISVNTEVFSLLSKTLGKERPSMFPKTWALMETRPFAEPYLAYPSGALVKNPPSRFPS
jgi:hypothetical protein